MTIIINQPGVFNLTRDLYENIIVNVAGVTINGNGFTVHGKSEFNSIGILSNGKGTVVNNIDVEGFSAGIHLGGAGSKVSDAVVYDCMTRGIGVAGGNGTIENVVVGYIGGAKGYNGVTVGVAVWGDNNTVSKANVHHILGEKESCGYIFGGKGILKDSLAQGQDSTGWSFGLWGGGGGTGGVTITNSYLHSWDEAIGNRGVITVEDSTLKGYHSAALGGFVDGGHVVTSQLTPNNAKYIRGTAERDHIVGGPGDSLIVGMGGGDTLYGGKGKDTFAPSPFGELTCIPDFKKGEDIISTNYYHHDNIVQNGSAATGSLATFLFNTVSHILYFDRDGAGPAAAQQIAYLPYVPSMSHSDFNWI